MKRFRTLRHGRHLRGGAPGGLPGDGRRRSSGPSTLRQRTYGQVAIAYSKLPTRGPSNRRSADHGIYHRSASRPVVPLVVPGHQVDLVCPKARRVLRRLDPGTNPKQRNVAITFEGFSNPKYLDGNELDGVKQEIVIYYGVGSHPRAGDFRAGYAPKTSTGRGAYHRLQSAARGPQLQALEQDHGLRVQLGRDYRSTGTITMTIQNQMPFLDTEGTGIRVQYDLCGYLTAEW